MKIQTIVCLGLAVGLISGCETEKCKHGKKHRDRQAKLTSEAKITKEAAEQTALAKVPDGTIKESELEKEHGKLQWSFDVVTPDSKDIMEVNVDAVTGNVISVDKESAEESSKTKQQENDEDKN